MPSREISSLRRIGDYLGCPPADIEWALSVQAMELACGNAKPLGEILVERECVAREVLAEALRFQRTDQLRRCSFFANLSYEELEEIGEQACQISLMPGETLFREGQKAGAVYVMLSGRLLLSHSLEGWEHPAGTVLPGDVLGEEEFLHDRVRPFSAYATDFSRLLAIRYDLIPGAIERTRNTALPYSSGNVILMTREIVRSDRAYFFLRDFDTGDLITQAPEGDPADGFRIKAGTDIPGWVALMQRPVNLVEAYLDPRFDPALDVLTDYWTRTLLAVPVLDDQGNVIGVLEALNKRFGPFNSDDEALLRALAHQYASLLVSSRR